MNKEKQLNRMKDIIDYNLNVLKEVIEEVGQSEIINNIDSYVVIELTVILYTIKEVTDITIEEINEHLIKEINMTYDDLREIEDQLIYL